MLTCPCIDLYCVMFVGCASVCSAVVTRKFYPHCLNVLSAWGGQHLWWHWICIISGLFIVVGGWRGQGRLEGVTGRGDVGIWAGGQTGPPLGWDVCHWSASGRGRVKVVILALFIIINVIIIFLIILAKEKFKLKTNMRKCCE